MRALSESRAVPENMCHCLCCEAITHGVRDSIPGPPRNLLCASEEDWVSQKPFETAERRPGFMQVTHWTITLALSSLAPTASSKKSFRKSLLMAGDLLCHAGHQRY